MGTYEKKNQVFSLITWESQWQFSDSQGAFMHERKLQVSSLSTWQSQWNFHVQMLEKNDWEMLL